MISDFDDYPIHQTTNPVNQYTHWGHGVRHDELAIACESWKLAELEPLDFKQNHVHQICKARIGDPSGFKSLLDGATSS